MRLTAASPIFVVSTGRAGSMMLARALAKLPRTLALHEPKPHLVTEGFLRWKGELDSDGAEALIRAKRWDIVEQTKTNGLLYIESSHYCSHLIPELARVFDARFVYLHRDARGFTESGLARSNWYPPSIDLAESFKGMVRRRLAVEVGHYWHDHRLCPPPGLQSRMEKIAWLWTEINRVILEGLAEVESERVFELRLDAVGPKSFAELMRFVSGETENQEAVLDTMLAVAHRRPNKRRSNWAAADVWDEAAFISITDGMSRRLGYSGPEQMV